MKPNPALFGRGAAIAVALVPLLVATSASAQEGRLVLAQNAAVKNLYAKAFKRSCAVTICANGLLRNCPGRRTRDGGCRRTGGACAHTFKRCH